MSGATNKVRNIAFACLWSILLWVGFAPVMAGQEKARLLERGLYTAYWKLFLVNCAWRLTAALLAPPMVYLVRRYPIAKPVTVRRIAGYIFGSVPWVIFSVCIRWILLPAWNSVTQELAPRSLQALVGNTYLFANQIWDYLVIIVSAHAYEYSMRARSEELELKWEQALAASELQTLKSQLQPHFLFNTLQGIATLECVEQKMRLQLALEGLQFARRKSLLPFQLQFLAPGTHRVFIRVRANYDYKVVPDLVREQIGVTDQCLQRPRSKFLCDRIPGR